MLEQLKLSCPAAVAVFGAGGKTSLIFALAAEAVRRGKRVIVTTTTHMYKPKVSMGIWDQLGFPYSVVWASSKDKILKAKENCIVVYGVEDCQNTDKIKAVEQVSLQELKTMADFVFVECDGAKGYPVKCPRDGEPVFLEGFDLYLGVMGLSAFGKPRREVCFHYELLFEDGEALWSKADYVTLAKQALSKGVPGKRFMIVLGQAQQVQKDLAMKLLGTGCEAVFCISFREEIEDSVWN